MRMLIRREQDNPAQTVRVAVVDIADNTPATQQASVAIRTYSSQQGGEIPDGVYQVEQLAAVSRFRSTTRRSSNIAGEVPLS